MRKIICILSLIFIISGAFAKDYIMTYSYRGHLNDNNEILVIADNKVYDAFIRQYFDKDGYKINKVILNKEVSEIDASEYLKFIFSDNLGEIYDNSDACKFLDLADKVYYKEITESGIRITIIYGTDLDKMSYIIR